MPEMKIGIVSDGRPKIKVTDMTREKAIDTLKRLKITHMGDFGWDITGAETLDFAISDMERVEQLEAENKRLKEDLSRWQEGEWNNCEECCNRLAYKLAELRDGIEKAKAEIDNSRTISLTYNTALDDCLSIINKHLGE